MGRFGPLATRAMSASCAIAFSLLVGTSAAAAGDVAVVLAAARVVVGEHGSEQLVTTEAVRPGDIVEYRATYTNQGDDTIHGLTATLPIPVDTNYLGLTATPGVEASTDGVSFGPIPLMRKVKAADGKDRFEPVPAAEYRVLRWQIGDLAANASRSVAARVVVPASASVARQALPLNGRHALPVVPADAERVALHE